MPLRVEVRRVLRRHLRRRLTSEHLTGSAPETIENAPMYIRRLQRSERSVEAGADRSARGDSGARPLREPHELELPEVIAGEHA